MFSVSRWQVFWPFCMQSEVKKIWRITHRAPHRLYWVSIPAHLIVTHNSHMVGMFHPTTCLGEKKTLWGTHSSVCCSSSWSLLCPSNWYAQALPELFTVSSWEVNFYFRSHKNHSGFIAIVWGRKWKSSFNDTNEVYQAHCYINYILLHKHCYINKRCFCWTNIVLWGHSSPYKPDRQKELWGRIQNEAQSVLYGEW